MKRKLAICAIILIALILIFCLYSFYPYYQVAKINKSIDVAGIKLLMPHEEVINKMNGEGNYIYGMGGFCHKYEDEKISIHFSNDSDSKAYYKVSLIETENPKHQVLDIHVGDSMDKTNLKLDEAGFKQEEENYYRNGDTFVYLTSMYNTVRKIRVGFIDRALIGRQY
jgi:hypothetical protein